MPQARRRDECINTVLFVGLIVATTSCGSCDGGDVLAGRGAGLSGRGTAWKPNITTRYPGLAKAS